MSDRNRPGDIYKDLDTIENRISGLERRMATLVSEPWKIIGDPFVPVVFQNSWTHWDRAGWGPVAYKKDSSGFVRLRGLIKGGTSLTAVMFQLPAGYRPMGSVTTEGEVFSVASASAAYAEVRVLANGNVFLQTGGSLTWTSLSQVAFSAEQ